MAGSGEVSWHGLTDVEQAAAAAEVVRWVIKVIDASGNLSRAALIRCLESPAEAIRLFASVDVAARIRRIEHLGGHPAAWWWEIRDLGPGRDRAEMMSAFNRAYYQGPGRGQHAARAAAAPAL